MKKINLSLLIGSCILIVLIFAMFFSHLLTDINPYNTQTMRSWNYENGDLNLQAPPYPPSKENPLGTDEMGRDVLGFIIYGTQLTLTISILVVMGRFLLAIPLGVAAGFGSYISKTIIEQCGIIFSALPALLMGIIILKMNFFANLYKEQSIIAFVLVLTVIDWAKLGKMIMERVQEILAKPFIKGEIAIGKSKMEISLENVIPHLTTELVILFFMEIARVLTMMMQFGIFGVFVGNMGFIADTEGGQTSFLNLSYEPEWASMLGSARNYIRTAPWTVLFPGIAFFISILSFNLIGEGLRKQLQERNSMYLVYLRRLLSFRQFEWTLGKKWIREKGHQVFVSGIALLVLFSFIGGTLWRQHMGVFQYEKAKDVFFNETFDEVLIGTDQGRETAENISEALAEIGLAPIDENGYVREYKTEDIYIPMEASVKIQGKAMEKKEFVHGEDFVFQSFGDMELSGKLNDVTEEDMLSQIDFSEFKDQFLLLDSDIYSEKGFDYLVKKIMTESEARGVFCILPEGEQLPDPMGKDVYRGAVMWLTWEMGKVLKSLDGGDVKVSLKSKKLESIGRNVVGVIPGSDPKIGEEAILLGVGYNYDQAHREIGEQRILFALELAKRLMQQNHEKSRTVIFVFWDGSLSNQYNGKIAYGKQPLYDPEKSELYIDLTKIDTDMGDAIYLGSRQAPISRYFSFAFNHQLENEIRKRNLLQKEYVVDISVEGKADNYMDKILYYEANTPTIILGIKDENRDSEKKITLDKLGEILLETIENNNH
ncbi:peptide/nickel transport system permease protein [Anaerosolibacter carboniphilus]|uniref:Peptide/nickel transport system permease protein n=1 Tax=Anaerosolibacter carboniphilus TaxID=1417629 RepID=A0A841KR04_9FIRM|nr:hypothetical protein [Anaerosolibacter carboniphilus]MBB6215781.1 peptide/nickel transport system permease protein [Anaerosolibacter carboniphilus]